MKKYPVTKKVKKEPEEVKIKPKETEPSESSKNESVVSLKREESKTFQSSKNMFWFGEVKSLQSKIQSFIQT